MINLLENSQIKKITLNLKERIEEHKERIIITIVVVILGSILAYYVASLTKVDALQIGIILVGIILSGIVTILGILWGRVIFQKIRTPKSNTNDKSVFPILPEFRDRYHEHVEGLFQEIKKNHNPVIKEKDYFTALIKTNEKKRMIFQHLRTIDVLSDTYAHLFALYKFSKAELNDADKRKKSVLRDVIEFDEKLSNYDFGHNDGEWIDSKLFKKAIGIKYDEHATELFSYESPYAFPSSINSNLYLVERDNEYQLGYAGHWFAKCKEKEKLEEFKKFIYDNGHQLDREIYDIHSKYHHVYQFSATWFNKEFKDHDEALEGEPILGSCYTCLSWFNAENVKRYKPVLDKFNSSMSNYEESVWTNVKEHD